jgi:hypothetical protein
MTAISSPRTSRKRKDFDFDPITAQRLVPTPLEEIITRLVMKVEYLTCELSKSRADVRRIQETLDGLLVARPVSRDNYHS